MEHGPRPLEMLVSGMVAADWSGRRVLVTGHTGFKGSWLALWLHQLGAEVTGFALPPPTDPSLFEAARVRELVTHVEGDVRDPAALTRTVEACRPDVIFHLAAQPLVRLSYDEPAETFATNVMGTVNAMEAARRLDGQEGREQGRREQGRREQGRRGQGQGVRAFVCITTDKCYENREWVWPYRENEPMGGHDPYSASKGAAELAVSAYRRSFFPPSAIADGGMALASVRAGNVIGGGDWASDRLIPDLVRAFEAGRAPEIRSPDAVRPWQHVLEALGGYLLIAERMLAGDPAMADAWNFGPADDDARPVSWIVDRMRAAWGGDAAAPVAFTGAVPHEAGLLRLDCSKARAGLGWRPALPLTDALGWIVDWHKGLAAGNDARVLTLDQIAAYRGRSGVTA